MISFFKDSTKKSYILDFHKNLDKFLSNLSQIFSLYFKKSIWYLKNSFASSVGAIGQATGISFCGIIFKKPIMNMSSSI